MVIMFERYQTYITHLFAFRYSSTRNRPTFPIAAIYALQQVTWAVSRGYARERKGYCFEVAPGTIYGTLGEHHSTLRG